MSYPKVFIAIFLTSLLLISCAGDKKERKAALIETGLGFDIYSLPDFCAHEHWGSIDAIGGYLSEFGGYYSDVYAGATPRTPVSIWDLVLDPYFSGMLNDAGIKPEGMALNAGFQSQKLWWDDDPIASLKGFKNFSGPLLMNGTIQCTLRGIEKLYDIKLLSFDVREWKKADSVIRKNYNDVFSWYKQAMTLSNFSEVIRPVQPEFYFMEESSESKAHELSFTHTIMRVDPFLDFWNVENKRRDNLASVAGIDPIDAGSWRNFIQFYVDLAEKNHTTGIKSLQAYNRDLNFKFREDKEVRFRGNLNLQEVKAFQDWVMNEFCRLANEKQWVHQVHIGTHNLKNSNPLPLEDLGARYPEMKIVMLHCWPFFNEVAYLAKNHANFYIDNCWTPILSPEFFEQAMNTYLNFVPYSKIMLSNDATSIEMATGSSLFIRKTLENKLLEQKVGLNLTDEFLRKAALDMLHNNAVIIYGVGNEVN